MTGRASAGRRWWLEHMVSRVPSQAVSHECERVQRNGGKTYVALGFAAAVEDRFLTPDGPLCLAATAAARWPAARARW